MSVEQIQHEVARLSEAERRKLTAWMVREFPPRAVAELVSRAEAQALSGEWNPLPPAADNIPTGEALAAALQRARNLGLSADNIRIRSSEDVFA